MNSYTDTRITPRGAPDKIRVKTYSGTGQVYTDGTWNVTNYSEQYQSITSVRTQSEDNPNWKYLTKTQKEHYLRRKKIQRMLTKFQRKVNPNPCVIHKVHGKRSGNMGFTAYSSTYKRYYELQGDPSAWVMGNRYGNLPRYSAPNASERRLIDNAIIKAYAKANSPSMPTLVYLGELGETLSMLRKPFSGIRKLFKKMKNSSRIRRRIGVQSYADSIADQWLEYRYGILPLMAQVDEICEAVAKRLLFGYPIKLTRDGVKIESATRRTRVPAAVVAPSHIYGTYYVEEYEEIGAYCTLAHNLQMDEAKYLGLRPRDVIPTVWELIPYSFVVDWFFNIGDWLQAIQPNPKLNVKSTSVSLKRMTRRCIDVVRIGALANMVGEMPCNSTCTVTEERLDRIVGLPKPVFPVFNEDFLKYQRVLDSVALGHGQLKRTLRALR